jgi:hypothetical protein
MFRSVWFVFLNRSPRNRTGLSFSKPDLPERTNHYEQKKPKKKVTLHPYDCAPCDHSIRISQSRRGHGVESIGAAGPTEREHFSHRFFTRPGDRPGIGI